MVGINSSFYSIASKDYWSILEKVEWMTAVDNQTELLYLKPKFPKRILRLEGKRITLEGYLEAKNGCWSLKRYLSSRGQYHDANPGLSEVVNLVFESPFLSPQKRLSRVQGKLKLHKNLQNNSIYSLENVVVLE